MKSVKAAKGERRAHSKAREARRDHQWVLTPLGGAMDPELAERLRAAMERLDPTSPWPVVAPMILPVLKRVRHPYPPDATPIHIQVPPGIPTGFGIDVGPAFSHVTAAMVQQWGVDHATLLGTALDNLRRLIADEIPVVQRFAHEGVAVIAISGMGWGSSLLLLPEALRPVLGPEPRVLLAPVRNTVIALPDDVPADVAVDIWDALADDAHDELEVPPLRWTGASVVGLGEGATGLSN